jgi:hypothetical protein
MTSVHLKHFFAERCDMNDPKLPRHAVYVRWGAFQLNIVGRWPILAWLTFFASIVGLKAFL